jgi:hypothetical protein
MEIAEINLNEVIEKPLLPADREMVLAVIKAEVRIAKTENSKTHQKEPYIACEMTPMDPEWAGKDYKIYHNFGLTDGSLRSPDPTFSVKKFFLTVGHPIRPDGKFSTEEIQTIQFVGKLSYDDKRPNFPQLAAVLRGAS